MAIENISTQIPREKPGRGIAEAADWMDAIRHGNIHDVLKTPGINLRDVEDYLAKQSKEFQNGIIQDYQVYASEGMIELPDIKTHFAIHNPGMSLDTGDRQMMQREMKAMMDYRAGGTEAAGEEAGTATPDVAGIAEGALTDWNEFFADLQTKVIDAQMFSQLKSKTEELQKEVQRVIDLVKQGIADPEFVLVAVAKVNMLQNGTFFAWKGKRVHHLNERMNKAAEGLYKMNPNDQGYMKELQMSQSATRGMSTQIQLEVMDLQKFAQNVATTLEWVSGAIRMFREMRQQPTQAIAAR